MNFEKTYSFIYTIFYKFFFLLLLLNSCFINYQLSVLRKEVLLLKQENLTLKDQVSATAQINVPDIALTAVDNTTEFYLKVAISVAIIGVMLFCIYKSSGSPSGGALFPNTSADLDPTINIAEHGTKMLTSEALIVTDKSFDTSSALITAAKPHLAGSWSCNSGSTTSSLLNVHDIDDSLNAVSSPEFIELLKTIFPNVH